MPAFARIAALVAALLASGCGASETAPTRLELADLARFTEQYDGKMVSTRGVVRSHPDPEHYWIEDEQLNRVAIQPDTAVKSHVGERVRVTGRFRFNREQGRWLESQSVELLDR